MTTNPLKNNRWITVEEVANEYGFSKTKQQTLRNGKQIPYLKVGGSIRYDRVALDQWLEDQSIGVEK